MRDWRQAVDPAHEPQRTTIMRADLIDPARGGRSVPLKVYYPVNSSGPHPAIIWSHGLGGSADGSAFLSRFLAAHGYVLIHVQHRGTDSSLWEGKPGHPWDVIRSTPIPAQDALYRFLDIPFVMNELSGWFEKNPEIPQIDPSRIGISGHSMGALTAQIMAGQTVARGGVAVEGLRDPRFKAGILYSPVPSSPGGGYDGISIPLFHMTGTADESPLEPFGHEKRIEVFEGAGVDGQHLLILDGGDHMVFTGSRGQLGANPKRKIHEDIIKVASLAFWDAHLADNTAAKTWLIDGGFTAWLAGEGEYRTRL